MVDRAHIWRISNLRGMVDRAHIWRTSNLRCKTSVVWLTVPILGEPVIFAVKSPWYG